MRMQKIIVIVGPTASGKSALAVRLAKKFNGEIISADSRQVYRGLDIGTGKVPGAWQNYYFAYTMRSHSICKAFVYQEIPHHCIDFVSPQRVFTAAQYVSHARRAIDDIARRDRVPIIAGGTMFWIDALVYGLSLPRVAPNARLRRALEKKSAAQLLAILKKCDPRRAAAIEQKNPRRLIRAIEIARALGRVPRLVKHSMFDTVWIGIAPPYERLTRRVARRVRAMIRQGLLTETKKLLHQGVSKKRIREFGFEYAAALDAIAKKITRAELEQRIIRDTKKYARRQIRWWKRNRDIHWIRNPAQAERAIKNL